MGDAVELGVKMDVIMWRPGPADLAEARKQRDLTRPFIQKFLEADELSIISRDSVAIVEDIKRGRLTAVQVTTAFCKTAAIAHQIAASAASAGHADKQHVVPSHRMSRTTVFMKNAGHKIVNWKPPAHAIAEKIHLAFLKADGAHDIHTQLGLSGEPLIPDLEESFKLEDPIGLLEYQTLTLQGLAYESDYSDY
ncbi:hypothetical protein F5Y14DRAFT_450857 [Nemania sp. NC0429]|nr:hypothetical protein F5Y14DRAFT_450857 [Nemania sp. NC0429]